jgi:hypothetical protein
VVGVETDIIGGCFQIGSIEIKHSNFTAHKKSIPDFGFSYKRGIYEPRATTSLDGSGSSWGARRPFSEHDVRPGSVPQYLPTSGSISLVAGAKKRPMVRRRRISKSHALANINNSVLSANQV